MSSKPAVIRQRDVTRIVKGAAAAGITMGIVVKDGEVRFVPVDALKAANEPSPEPDAEEAYRQWKAGNG
jgi:hypothetical protein